MERLPYIDEHRTRMAGAPADVWDALLSVLRTHVAAPARGPATRLLGLTPPRLQGDWHGRPQPGDSLPGFVVEESAAPRRLALRGEHRFSRYALVFTVDEASPDSCVLSARSWAEFPGVAGRGYRALVIGTGGHRVAVRRLLRSVARRA